MWLGQLKRKSISIELCDEMMLIEIKKKKTRQFTDIEAKWKRVRKSQDAKFYPFKHFQVTQSVPRLPRASFSRKNTIFTPRPSAAAHIQTTFRVPRPQSCRRMNNSTKTQFLEQIEEEMNQGMMNSSSNWDQFLVYRDAFGKLIDHFEKYRNSMTPIKVGYDDLIDKMKKEVTAHLKFSKEALRSQTNLNLMIDQQKGKYDKKYKAMLDMIELINKQINALTEEIKDLSRQKEVEEKANKIADQSAHEEWVTLQLFLSKKEKKEVKLKRIDEDVQQVREKKKNLEETIVNLHNQIGSTLDTIVQQKRMVRTMNQDLVQMRETNERATANLKNLYIKLDEERNYKITLEESNSKLKVELQSAQKEYNDCMMYLNELAFGLEGPSVLSPEDKGDITDPVYLLQTFLDRRSTKI